MKLFLHLDPSTRAVLERIAKALEAKNAPVEIVIDDPIIEPPDAPDPEADLYAYHNLPNFIEDGKQSGIARVLYDTHIFAAVNEESGDNLLIEKWVAHLAAGTIINAFAQPKDVMYDGDAFFIQYIGVENDTSFRGNYVWRKAIEWIVKPADGRK